MACVTAITPKTFVSNTARVSASGAAVRRFVETASWKVLPALAREIPAFVHENVQPAKLLADAAGCGIDRSRIRNVELNGEHILSETLRCFLALLQLSRPKQHGHILLGSKVLSK